MGPPGRRAALRPVPRVTAQFCCLTSWELGAAQLPSRSHRATCAAVLFVGRTCGLCKDAGPVPGAHSMETPRASRALCIRAGNGIARMKAQKKPKCKGHCDSSVLATSLSQAPVPTPSLSRLPLRASGQGRRGAVCYQRDEIPPTLVQQDKA